LETPRAARSLPHRDGCAPPHGSRRSGAQSSSELGSIVNPCAARFPVPCSRCPPAPRRREGAIPMRRPPACRDATAAADPGALGPPPRPLDLDGQNRGHRGLIPAASRCADPSSVQSIAVAEDCGAASRFLRAIESAPSGLTDPTLLDAGNGTGFMWTRVIAQGPSDPMKRRCVSTLRS
jgi:hypothetical protein